MSPVVFSPLTWPFPSQPEEIVRTQPNPAAASPTNSIWCAAQSNGITIAAMEERGFEIISCAPADPGLVTAAKAEFQRALESSEKTSSKVGCIAICKFGLSCRTLFHHGIDLASTELITRYCGPYDAAEKDEWIYTTPLNNPRLPPSIVGPGKVLLFKPIDQELNEEVGFLKCFEGSHGNLSIEGVKESSVLVRLNNMLVMDGDTVIRWPMSGGCVFMLQGIKKKSLS